MRDRNAYINGNYDYDYGGQPDSRTRGPNYDVSGRNRRKSVFAAGRLEAECRLTLNLGVRLDHVSGARRTQTASTPTPMVAPRLGFVLDLTGQALNGCSRAATASTTRESSTICLRAGHAADSRTS